VHAQPDAARVLLEGGARVDAEDAFGNQPLFKAVMGSRGDCELIHLLLDAGADPEHPNHSGNSALSTANLIANYDVKRCFDRD
jgi:ankyrin repeat protein